MILLRPTNGNCLYFASYSSALLIIGRKSCLCMPVLSVFFCDRTPSSVVNKMKKQKKTNKITRKGEANPNVASRRWCLYVRASLFFPVVIDPDCLGYKVIRKVDIRSFLCACRLVSFGLFRVSGA